MAPREPTLVGAIFTDRLSASRAAAALRARGLADARITSAVWTDSRWVIDSPAGEEVETSLARGAMVGAAVGFLIGGLIGLLLWPNGQWWTRVALAGGAVAIAGTVLGGYFGLDRHVDLLWDERDWAHVTLSPDEVLVVVAIDQPDEGRSLLADHGGRVIEPAHPG